MDKVTRLTEAEKRELFGETAAQMNLRPGAVEKDFWVCWTLKELFDIAEIKERILFKGGTSLSKIFHLIDRFSEDIDIILDWRTLGFTDETAWKRKSKTQQAKLNERINVAACEYIAASFLPLIQKRFLSKLNPDAFKLVHDQDQPHIIRFFYPLSLKDAYLRPEIQLEIGPLASRAPHESHPIIPYAAEKFDSVFDNPIINVTTINAERTFWEKATILHQEAHRKSSRAPLRYSRHYYDLHMMANRDVKDVAFVNVELLRDVVAFKKQFYHCSWAEYDSAKPGTFRLMPSDKLMSSLEDDYSRMRNMIFGEYPSFNMIVESLTSLEDEINCL